MSDEVSQFLEQVERLRGQQVEEDEVRARELEEYLAAKKERQARREERARSISPQKSSPANTPSPRSSRHSVRLSEALKVDSPPARATQALREASENTDVEPPAMEYSSSPTKENEAPGFEAKKPALEHTPSTRGTGLAWQRRPPSRGAPGGGRPLSMVATQNATQKSLAGSPEPQSATETNFSREQIAQSLGSKDPAWFRQTADRGLNSAAYRKNQVEDEERADPTYLKKQLPGMSADPAKNESSQTNTPGQSPSKIASPHPLNPPQFEKPEEESPSSGGLARSPSGHTSPTRSTSPTKGMGGFVQSAMMKRSDSVKRWSVQSPSGLARANTVTATRTPYGRDTPTAPSKTPTLSRGASATPSSSRQVSQQSDREDHEESTPLASTIATRIDTKPDLGEAQDLPNIPISPSRTMDPRRWSPTKGSWLDSALNKPDSPKPSPKPHSTQPAWMAELNKNKAEGSKAGPGHKHQVSIGGLMRSTPMGEAAKTNTTGLGGIYSPPPGGNRPAYGHRPQMSLSKAAGGSLPSPTEGDTTGEGAASKPEEHRQEDAVSDEPEKTAPPPLKPKPETPPKKDFRTNLKQRSEQAAGGKGEELEFRKAFGSLRRAKTQNYVAPDEFKTNILRGKAALNLTGGPQKSERKDEFKEAILKKKDDFKKVQEEGKGVVRTSVLDAEQPVPEGLARRGELGRTAGAAKLELDAFSSSRPKPVPGPKRIPSQPSSAENLSAKLERVSTEPDATKTDSEPRPLPQLKKETSAPSKLQGRIGGGKLADRFNPALAGMLARGPPMATEGGRGSSGSPSGGPTAPAESDAPAKPGPQLTHMTKGRARGPRRKAPTAAPAAQMAQEPVSQSTESTKSPKLDEIPKSHPKAESNPLGSSATASESKSAPFSIQQQVAAKAALRGKGSEPELKSTTPVSIYGGDMNRTLPFRRGPPSPERETPRPLSPIKPHKTGGDVSQPGSPKKLDVKRMSKFLDDSSITTAGSESAKDTWKLAPQRTGSRSPVKREESSYQKRDPSFSPVEDVAPLKLPSRTAIAANKLPAPSPAPKPAEQTLRSLPSTPDAHPRGARPLPNPPSRQLASPAAPTSPLRSPTKQASEISTLITDFFGPERPTAEYKLDPASVIAQRPEAGLKVDSLRYEMFQVTGDGKKMPLDAQFERTLFEQEMYVGTHEFKDDNGRPMCETYFWVGDEVPESIAEDAQLFAAREARSRGGKLVRLRQGKESSRFLQAFGGVVIIRRGSSHKFDSLAPCLLCGRRYLGEIAFDEVDFASSSLCAGFPYLVTKGGNCYIWKGKGSNIDELSCARLVGMELTLTGDLTELEEGSEPESFWGIFDSAVKPHSADHWRLKPNYSKYCGRLFCSDAESRQQIFELSPFSQADLSPFSIYVLDAFFEMYVIVGSKAQSQFSSFRNALNFAQEYAILAASMEDRPFVPVSTVVMEGAPRDLKRVFRKWRDEKSPTIMNQPPAIGIKRGRSLRVVSLTQALQALKE